MERKMSREFKGDDLRKMTQDSLADLRAKGVDAQEIHSVHPEGLQAALNHMKKNLSAVRDQSQEQTARNREGMRKR